MRSQQKRIEDANSHFRCEFQTPETREESDSENQSDKKKDVQDSKLQEHKQGEDGKKQMKSTSFKILTCSECGKLFTRVAALEGHMRMHAATNEEHNLEKQDQEDNLKKQEFNRAKNFQCPRKEENRKYSKRSSRGINPMAKFNDTALSSMGVDTHMLKAWADKARQEQRPFYADDIEVLHASETLSMISHDPKWINPFKGDVGTKRSSSVTSRFKAEKSINPESRSEDLLSAKPLEIDKNKDKVMKSSPITWGNKAEKGINQDFHRKSGFETSVSKNLQSAEQLLESEMKKGKNKAIKDCSDDHPGSRRSSGEATKKCLDFDLNELPDEED